MACCDICGDVFTLQINLKRHISVQHKESDPIKSHDCDQCDYSGTYTNLMQHNHKKLLPHTCFICYKGFARKDVLKQHMKSVHNNENTSKPKVISKVLCRFCRKKFSNENNF